jgi:nucleotide-binding universal stress UspA family protein
VSESEVATEQIPEGGVVVGIDGSETADRAVAWAARYASLEGLPLVIAYALPLIGTPEAAPLTFDAGGGFAIVYEHLMDSGHALVAAAAETVTDAYPSVVVTPVVEHNDARQLLLRLAESAALVVMGSRGRGPFRSLVLGSVTAGVAGQAGCPVVVVPAGDDAGE